jgi:hypothetical protein
MESITSAFNPLNIKYVYTMFSGKKREKLDLILEPLQAMIQLSMMACCPVGSKLAITENLLVIQLPGVSQGIIRYFNDDTKEDLCYLFNVFRRFIVYYNHLRIDEKYKPLYDILIELSKSGLTNLIQTYTNSNKVNILQTLQMYRLVLDKPDFFAGVNKDVFVESRKIKLSTGGTDKSNASVLPETNSLELEVAALNSVNTDCNIDNIFDKIVNIYTHEELVIIYNVLTLMKKSRKDTARCIELINGLNLIMTTTSSKIKKWINDNIAL